MHHIYDNPAWLSAYSTVISRLALLTLAQREIDTQHLEALRGMIEADPIAELHDQDKELIWRLREECRFHFPNCLARLVLCVDWNNHVQVALMQVGGV